MSLENFVAEVAQRVTQLLLEKVTQIKCRKWVHELNVALF